MSADSIDCSICCLLFFLLLSINKQRILLLTNRENNNLFLYNNNLFKLFNRSCLLDCEYNNAFFSNIENNFISIKNYNFLFQFRQRRQKDAKIYSDFYNIVQSKNKINYILSAISTDSCYFSVAFYFYIDSITVFLLLATNNI